MAAADKPSVVKLELKGDVRRVRLQEVTFAALQEAVSKNFREQVEHGYVMKYLDEEGDLCSLTPETFPDFEASVAAGQTAPKLKVVPQRRAPSNEELALEVQAAESRPQPEPKAEAEQTAASEPAAAQTAWRCVVCGTENDASRRKCVQRGCRHPGGPDAAWAAKPDSWSRLQHRQDTSRHRGDSGSQCRLTWPCSRCGYANAAWRPACRRCGEGVVDAARSRSAPRRRRPSHERRDPREGPTQECPWAPRISTVMRPRCDHSDQLGERRHCCSFCVARTRMTQGIDLSGVLFVGQP